VQVWRVVPTASLRYRHWEDGVVAFECHAGDTHLLTPLAAWVLQALSATPRTESDLLASVTDAAEAPVDAHHITAVLTSLRGLDLVEPVPE
jgi:PqqD family protein of HPr-rel-A system